MVKAKVMEKTRKILYCKSVAIINIDGEYTRLKMEFLHYSCFSAIVKLIVRSHYMLLNLEQIF